MKKLFLLIFSFTVFLSFNSSALNITIIESHTFQLGNTMDSSWYTLCTQMGHNATIDTVTKLDLESNLSTTDILIVSSALDTALTPARPDVIIQYLQNGGKVY